MGERVKMRGGGTDGEHWRLGGWILSSLQDFPTPSRLLWGGGARPPRSLQRAARPSSARLSSARLGSACRPLGGTAGSRTAPRRRRLLHPCYLRRCRVRPPGAAAPRVSPVPGSPLLTSRLMRGTAGGSGAQIILKERRKITMGNRHEAGFVSPLLQ